MSEEPQHPPQSILGPEKIEWRGIDSKVYEKIGQPGQYQLVGFEGPVHWLDTEGKLQDIDLTIKDGKVDQCCYIAEIMKDNFGLKIQYRDTMQKFEIIIKDIDGIKILGREPDKIENGCVAIWNDVAKDLDIAFEFQQDKVRIFRKLKTKDAPTKIHFETITQELIAEEQVQVNQKFFGMDAKGREVILETKFDEPVTEAQKDGFRLVKQQIHDEFTKQIVLIDEKTRVRTKGDDVEYPVTIDPVVTLRAKDMDQNGFMAQYFSGATLTSGYVWNRGRTRLIRNEHFGSGGTVTIAPGESIGIILPNSGMRDASASFNFNRLTMSKSVGATGTFEFKQYRASDKTLKVGSETQLFPITNGDVASLSTTPTLQMFNFKGSPPDETLGGLIVVVEFLAGGTGTIGIEKTAVAPTKPEDGYMAKKSTGGAWSTITGSQPGMQIYGKAWKGLAYQDIYAFYLTYGLSQAYTTGTSGYARQEHYSHFKGITIPQGSTINSAIITLSMSQSFPPQFDMRMRAVNDKSFALPNPTGSRGGHNGGLGSPTSIRSQLIKRTAGVPFVKKTATPTADLTVPVILRNTTMTVGGNEWGNNARDIDVQTIVQKLVNSFDYNNDSMFFQLGIPPGTPTGVSTGYVSSQIKVYTRANSTFNKATVVPYTTNPAGNQQGQFRDPNKDGFLGAVPGGEVTATSQGVSTRVPKLVIDFTAGGGATDLNFVADAMLLYQGAVFGQCGAQPW